MISDGESSMGTAFENTAGYRDALQDAGLEGRTLYVQSGARSAQIFEALKDELDLSLHTLIYVAAPELLKAVFRRCVPFRIMNAFFLSIWGSLALTPKAGRG